MRAEYPTVPRSTPTTRTHPSASGWLIALDTGGTFTDIVARDPSGAVRRAKVPSDGSLLATVVSIEGARMRIRPAAGLVLPDGLLDGWIVTGRATGSEHSPRIVAQRGDALEIEPAPDAWRGEALPVGKPIRFAHPRGGLDAPRLGLHIVTGTPLDTPLPQMELRLSTTRGTNALLEGKGAPVAPGDPVTVHFDCIFRKIVAVSTRSARLLGGNRVIAEPFSFVAASQLDAPKTVTTDAGGGLFSGQSGPKAPQAVSYAVVGMKPGGKRSVFVPAVLGYGSKGEQEIPPNCPEFELEIELLSVGGGQ